MDQELWDEQIEHSKYALGLYADFLSPDQWDAVVKHAKESFRKEASERAKEEHSDYIKSDVWRKIRLLILERDNFTCKDCNLKLRHRLNVHHKNYSFFGEANKDEISSCVTLCYECHAFRHNLITSCRWRKENYYWKLIQDGRLQEAWELNNSPCPS